MATNSSKNMPKGLIEWLTVLTLIIGISASLYGGIVKPYNLIRNMEVKVAKLEKDIEDLDKCVERLMTRIFYKN